MKHIEPEQFLSAVSAPVMTRKRKLEQWADLIQQTPYVRLVHNMEHWPEAWFELPVSGLYLTAFNIAIDDPVFKKMDIGDSIRDVMKFFEVDKKDLHEFTCDCGGAISSRRMANRIRKIADPSWRGWFASLLAR